MLSIVKNKLTEYTTPKLTLTTLDMSGRTTPLPITLNETTYNAPGTYTLLAWTNITYPTGYTGTGAFAVSASAGSKFAVRDVRMAGSTLVADISEARLWQ